MVATQKASSAFPNQGRGAPPGVRWVVTDRSCHAEQVGREVVRKWARYGQEDMKSSASDEESEESGEESRRGMAGQVQHHEGGPPKGIRCAMGRADAVEDELTAAMKACQDSGRRSQEEA